MLGSATDVQRDGCHEKSCLAFSNPLSRSNALKEMVNRYHIRYQGFSREVTEEVFAEASDDVILEALHTVKPSSLTLTPRELFYFC